MRRQATSTALTKTSPAHIAAQGGADMAADVQIPGGIIGPRPLYDYRALISIPTPKQYRNERRKFPRVEVAASLAFGAYNLPVEDISGTGMKLAQGCPRAEISLRPFEAELFFVVGETLFKQKLLMEFVDREAPFPTRLHTRVVIDSAEPLRARI